MNTRMTRREFLSWTITVMGVKAAAPVNLLGATMAGRRVFVAGFSHETNTFHPVATRSYSYSQGGNLRLAAWNDHGLVVVPGVSAYPSGGGTIAEPACREAMAKVLASLRSALPVDAVFLRLHGAMYAEGMGPAETELVRAVRAVVGQKIPIACTFDLHGNIPARMAQFGDILVGLKTAPHTDGAQTGDWRNASCWTPWRKGASDSVCAAHSNDPPRRESDDHCGAISITRGRGAPPRARRSSGSRGEDPGRNSLRGLRLDGLSRYGDVGHGGPRMARARPPGQRPFISREKSGRRDASSPLAAKPRNWETASPEPWPRMSQPCS